MTFNLVALGWDADRAADYVPRADHSPGRVARVDQGVCTVLLAAGTARASMAGRMLATAARDPRQLPCAGDWVVVRQWPDQRTTLEKVLPRRTSIVRAGAGRDALGQVVAANADTVAVVEALDPEPDLARVERLLALAWDSGAVPVVVLTKADLVADPAPLVEEMAAVAPGVEVIAVSATTGAGIPELCRHTGPGQTLGLLGASGVGKSSLVNALAGATVMTARALRVDGRGRHTTTFRALVPLPGGGAVLDTPGLRKVGLYDSDGLDRTFADIEELATGCRFRDCQHDHEPGCAVQDAVAAGLLPPRRLASMRKLEREQAFEARRRGGRLAAAAARAAWRQGRR